MVHSYLKLLLASFIVALPVSNALSQDTINDRVLDPVVIEKKRFKIKTLGLYDNEPEEQENVRGFTQLVLFVDGQLIDHWSTENKACIQAKTAEDDKDAFMRLEWNKDQDGAYNSSSLTGGTIARYSQAPTANSTSSPDRTVQVVSDSGAGQHFYCSTSQWHPWAKRLIIPGRPRTGSARTISTISFANAMADMSYGVGLTELSYMSYNGPHFVPIPGTHAFIVVYYDTTDSNKLTYRTIDIKLGRTASEDDFVVSAARQIDTNSNDKCAAVWDQNRNAMVVSSNHTSEQRFYGVKPQLGISNARNFLGFASSTVSDTQTLTVHLPGAINENQSSLVTGRRYLVGHDGNLIEADNNVGKSQGMPFVGTAISATKIAVGV